MKVNFSSWTPHQGKEGMKFQGFSTSLILKMVKNGEVVPEDWVERLSGVTCLHPTPDPPTSLLPRWPCLWQTPQVMGNRHPRKQPAVSLDSSSC